MVTHWRIGPIMAYRLIRKGEGMDDKDKAKAIKVLLEFQDLLSKYKDVMTPEDKKQIEERMEFLRAVVLGPKEGEMKRVKRTCAVCGLDIYLGVDGSWFHYDPARHVAQLEQS
jgi:hypothetical protein